MIFPQLLFIISSVVLVTSDCGKDICVSDFLKDFFKDHETAVFKTQNGSIVEEEIEIVDLDTILQKISDLLTKESNDTALVRNYENKTYVFVKTLDFHDGSAKNTKQISVKPTKLSNSTNLKVDLVNSEEVTSEKVEEILKKAIEEDNEITNNDIENLYIDFDDDNSTDYPDIDYIEIYKDTTVEEYLYVPTEATVGLLKEIDNENKKVETLVQHSIDMVEEYNNDTNDETQAAKTEPFIPWITTIFVMNQTNNNQYDYLCDGILVSENAILTGARCVRKNNKTIDPKDLLVVLGKKSLQTMADSEKITKIKNVVTHENFTNNDGKIENDLAMLIMEVPVAENRGIQVANISDTDDFDVESDEAATTAWSLSGEITPIYFENSKKDMCARINKVENTICTTYGNDVALCPSYGGLYAVKIEDDWYLQGVFYGDPADRGICFTKSVIYTSLQKYLTWIMDTISSY